MLAIFNASDSSVQLVPSSPQIKSTPDEILYVRLVENLNAAAPPTERLLAAGETLELVILPKGQREGDSLVITGDIARDAQMSAYGIPVNAFTDAIVELLKLNDNDATTDVLAKDVEGWLRLVQVSPARPILSAAFAISLVSAPSFSDIGSPTAIPGADTKYLRFDAATQTLSDADKTRVLARIGAATAAQGALAATAVQPAGLSAYATTSALTSGLAGKADLSGGKVPSSQLPSYVDDVVEAADYASLPGTGETGKLYVTLDSNKTYRWSGSVYVEISSGLDLASEAEAAAGTDNSKAMTPLRTAQAIAALAPGGGGGSSMLRSVATILGFTSPATPAVQVFVYSPGTSSISYGNWSIGDWTGSYTDFPAPSGWTADKSLNEAQSAGGTVTFTRSVTGSGISPLAAPDLSGLQYYDSAEVSYQPWNGTFTQQSFTDGTNPSGAITAPNVVNLYPGMITRPISIGWASISGLVSNNVEVGFLDEDNTFTPLALISAPAIGTFGILSPPPASVYDWINGRQSALVARLVGECPMGGDVLVWAVVDQIAD